MLLLLALEPVGPKHPHHPCAVVHIRVQLWDSALSIMCYLGIKLRWSGLVASEFPEYPRVVI